MMWKTLVFLAVVSVVVAGKIKRHETKYEFHIKHDYDYHKHHEKSEGEADNTEQTPQEEQESEQNVENTEEPQQESQEEQTEEPEQQNESDDSNTESEEPGHDEKYEYPGYEFMYKVKDPHTHDIKGQHEKKYGGEVKGVYWLLQPDGYKRTVDYTADKHNGFHAKVNYSKPEKQEEGEEHDLSKPTSEYYFTTYHGHKEYIPVKEEQEEEQEQDRQEESAHHIPIYVI